jgi:hypothetical protein
MVISGAYVHVSKRRILRSSVAWTYMYPGDKVSSGIIRRSRSAQGCIQVEEFCSVVHICSAGVV